MKEYSFKHHQLSEAKKIWLKEVADTNPFDPRVAKVKLLDKLPKNEHGD